MIQNQSMFDNMFKQQYTEGQNNFQKSAPQANRFYMGPEPSEVPSSPSVSAFIGGNLDSAMPQQSLPQLPNLSSLLPPPPAPTPAPAPVMAPQQSTLPWGPGNPQWDAVYANSSNPAYWNTLQPQASAPSAPTPAPAPPAAPAPSSGVQQLLPSQINKPTPYVAPNYSLLAAQLNDPLAGNSVVPPSYLQGQAAQLYSTNNNIYY
jgi:hypothetical protein